MTLAHFRTLFDYHIWANQRIRDTASPLSVEQLTQSRGPDGASIRDTLVHTLNGQWIWLSRSKGVSPRTLLNPRDYPDLTAINAHWSEHDRELLAFIAALDDAALARAVNYSDTRDNPQSLPLWQLLHHQLHHGTQHRSEMALWLTELGHSPGELGFREYLRQAASY